MTSHSRNFSIHCDLSFQIKDLLAGMSNCLIVGGNKSLFYKLLGEVRATVLITGSGHIRAFSCMSGECPQNSEFMSLDRKILSIWLSLLLLLLRNDITG